MWDFFSNVLLSLFFRQQLDAQPGNIMSETVKF